MPARPDLRPFALKARNLKCFADWQGFDAIYPVNVIVGRNNAGKSTLLDVVGLATGGPWDNPACSRGGQRSSIQCSFEMTKEVIEPVFLASPHYQQMEGRVRDKLVLCCVGIRAVTTYTAHEPIRQQLLSEGVPITDTSLLPHAEFVRDKVGNPFKDLTVVRLRAERDVRPEQAGDNDSVGEHGEHATRLVEHYLNEARQGELVDRDLLKDLNAIMEPDWSFTRIFPQRVPGGGGVWELHLRHQRGVDVPLSQSGSGVKTVLLVLINLILVPHAKKKPDLSQYVFLFEELENNLHPAVQRRLFRFLREKAVKENFTLFLTTHSNVVIDLFSRDDQAQLLHVQHDGDKATVTPATCYLRQCHVLDDLEVKASDLLQANVVVWVEGPSDRLYFNKWIELWTGGALLEQVHYQCVWYGGAMLAGLTFEDDFPGEDLVAALRVNRHAVVLMDSDKREQSDLHKDRVQRVVQEAERAEAIAWITAGREVENYIPVEALQLALNQPGLEPAGQFADVYDHVNRRKDKVAFARLVVPYLTREMLAAHLDLGEQLDHVCQAIRCWNGMGG